MTETLIERVWAWLHATFPERQIYIRSDGRVQFFTFGPTLQATLAGLSLIFLGWVAFASVNVIFKDRIIAAKDHRYQQMQSTYENRVADLQVSYDDLNGALIAAEDTFKSTADQLEAKQRTVVRLLSRKDAVDNTLANLRGTTASAAADEQNTPVHATSNTAADNVDASPPAGSAIGGDDTDGNSEIGVMPDSDQPQPRTAKPAKASFLDNAVGRLAAAFFPQKKRAVSHKVVNRPAFRVLEAQTVRLNRMSRIQTSLLVAADSQLSGSIGDIEAVMRRVGINPDRMEQEASDVGVGGPFIPIDAMRIEGISDTSFTKAFAGVSAHVKELDTLFAAFRHVPLARPIHGSEFELTSGFGARVDPFTRRLGFHPGVDFGGPWGASIVATAPGVVDWAGYRGGYGQMVEIDHGFGIKTRYAHMSSIFVKIGARVDKGTPVGKLGSTGRSTGPHVHYEVWLGDVVRDPSRFIEAGRHVLK